MGNDFNFLTKKRGMLKQVSVNRFNELKEDIEKLINDYSKYPKLAEILRDVSGLKISL